MPNFGQHTGRPGGEPPPRRQLTPEEIRVRETFNRAEHLAGVKSQPAQPSNPEVKAFDEAAIRAALLQEGLDFSFQVFPVGEGPVGTTGRAANREARIEELEKKIKKLVERATQTDKQSTDHSRRIHELTTENDTLHKELESLKSPAQEAV